MSTIGIILAGGMARRMGGQDKALLPFKNEKLLNRAIGRLLMQVVGVALSSNSDPDTLTGYGVPVIADADEERAGPLAGVLAGMVYAEGVGATHIVTVAVDTPFFPLDLVSRLTRAAEEAEMPLACAATDDRTHPTFGLWPVSLRADLEEALAGGTRKVDEWTAKHGCAVASWKGTPSDPFFNVNTPEDLIEAERLAS